MDCVVVCLGFVECVCVFMCGAFNVFVYCPCGVQCNVVCNVYIVGVLCVFVCGLMLLCVSFVM